MGTFAAIGAMCPAPRGGLYRAIQALFLNAEKGVWYDPSDLTSMFQDSAGTTAAVVGQPVGLVLDKSKGLVLGAELVTANIVIANGASANVVGTTANGFMKVIAPSTANLYVYDQRAGGWVDSGNKIVQANASGATGFLNQTGAEVTLIAGQVSVKELPGYHATQSTSTARPILARHPIGGRRNLLTYTEDFSNAAWANVNSTETANALAAPDGTTTADYLVDDATNAKHSVYYSTAAIIPAGNYVLSCYMKAGTRNFGALIVNNAGNGRGAVFNLATGTIDTDNLVDGTGGTVSSATASISSVGNGWYRCSILVVSSGANSAVIAHAATGTFLYAGSGQNIAVWGAQVEAASLTAYQKATSTYDVTEAGVNDAYYLKFDGVDDFLVTPSIDFSGTDKMSVFAGVRKLSDAAVGMVLELSATAFGNNGAFMLTAPPVIASATYRTALKGTLYAEASTSAVFAAPVTNVISIGYNIAGDSIELRANGSSAATSTADFGTGNFGNYPLYIGMRAGTSLPFNGHLYSLVVRGALSDAAQIAASESYVNSKTGAY